MVSVSALGLCWSWGPDYGVKDERSSCQDVRWVLREWHHSVSSLCGIPEFLPGSLFFVEEVASTGFKAWEGWIMSNPWAVE